MLLWYVVRPAFAPMSATIAHPLSSLPLSKQDPNPALLNAAARRSRPTRRTSHLARRLWRATPRPRPISWRAPPSQGALWWWRAAGRHRCRGTCVSLRCAACGTGCARPWGTEGALGAGERSSLVRVLLGGEKDVQVAEVRGLWSEGMRSPRCTVEAMGAGASCNQV